MKLIYWGKDGGPESKVWGLWLPEIKSLFSVALLKFEDGSREAFHTHAFNSISWVLKGKLREFARICPTTAKVYVPGVTPIITKRATFHKVVSDGTTWVLTFRGPWTNTWKEYANDTMTTLSHGRRVVA